MLSLPEDDRPHRPLLLREDAMRGGAPAIAGEQGRLSISAPFSIPLDEALVAGDSELDAFWKGQRELFDFDYVTFRCDFAPAEGAPIEKAWVQVKLKGAKDCRNAAVIWSMSPFRDEDFGKATLSAKDWRRVRPFEIGDRRNDRNAGQKMVPLRARRAGT